MSVKQRAQSGQASTQFIAITIPAGGWSLNTLGLTTFRTGVNATALPATTILRDTDVVVATAPAGTLGLRTTGGANSHLCIAQARVDTASVVTAGVQVAGVIAIDILVTDVAGTLMTLASGQVIQVRVERRT